MGLSAYFMQFLLLLFCKNLSLNMVKRNINLNKKLSKEIQIVHFI